MWANRTNGHVSCPANQMKKKRKPSCSSNGKIAQTISVLFQTSQSSSITWFNSILALVKLLHIILIFAEILN